MQDDILTVYTTFTCGQCWATKSWLKRQGVPFREVHIETDGAARAFIRKVADGHLSVPTLVFPDGRVLIEPSRDQLEAALR